MIFPARTFILIGASVILLTLGRSLSAQTRPDLTVSSMAITADLTGLFVEAISVTVTNVCSGSVAGPSHLLLTFKESNALDAKTIYYVSSRITALKGGESRTQSFKTGDLKVGIGRHVVAEVDPYKKVTEASEDNNWRTLFPDGAGMASGKCTSTKR